MSAQHAPRGCMPAAPARGALVTGLRPTPRVVAAGLLGGIALASGVALTATSGWLIVRASERPVILTLLTAIVAVRTFGIARPVFRYAERLVSHDSALRDLASARTAVYDRLVPLTPARLGRRRRTDVLTGVVDDLTDVVESQVRVTVPVITALVAGLLAVGLTAAFSTAISVIVGGLLLVVAAGSTLAWWLESAGQDELSSARAEVARVTELVTQHGDAVRAIGAQSDVLGWLDLAQDRLVCLVRRQSWGRALASLVILVAVGAATVAVAQIAQGLDVGGPVQALLILIPVAVADALSPLVDAMKALARAQAADRRLHAVLDQVPAVLDPAATAAAADEADGAGSHESLGADASVRLRELTASWTGERVDLAPVDLDVAPGARVAVIGANGSGKSTLLAVLARHLDPRSGSYELGATSVTELPLDAARERLAVVDDETHVFSTSLRENLRLAATGADSGGHRDDAGDHPDDADLVTALRSAGLGAWIDALPEGLDTRLGTGGRGLSGGERARLGVACAVLSRRPVILLDEPVAQLDPPTAREVLADVFSATRGRSLVMVTHRTEGLELADALLELHAPMPQPTAPQPTAPHISVPLRAAHSSAAGRASRSSVTPPPST